MDDAGIFGIDGTIPFLVLHKSKSFGNFHSSYCTFFWKIDLTTSYGFIQKVKELRIDDDQDTVWMSVDIGSGSSCHVGYRSCFYRSIPLGKIDNGRNIEMKFEEKEKKFDPEEIYRGQPNPTKI